MKKIYSRIQILNQNKKSNFTKSAIALGALSVSVALLAPTTAHACACGCGVFEVGTSSMFPQRAGGTAFVEYDYQDQNQNWSGTSSAPAANNDDKEIETHFISLGLQYMFNRKWGAQLEVPYDFRYFKGVDDGGHPFSRRWSSLGDIRIKAIYTGFSADMSSGVSLGLKLPTGSYNRDADVVDRDTQIGTGSTDVLLGGFFRHALVSGTGWRWFTQASLDVPALKQGDYRPGIEADAAGGIYYNGINVGRVGISPLAQIIGSWRGRDNGAAASPRATGYQRILLSPGIEFDMAPVKLYADVEFPVYQNVTGNQVVAPALVKATLSYSF